MAYKQSGWSPYNKKGDINPITGKPLKSNEKLDHKTKTVIEYKNQSSPSSDIKKTHESNVWANIDGKETELAHTFTKGARTKQERGREVSYTTSGEKIIRKAKKDEKWRTVKRKHIGTMRAGKQVKRKLKRYTSLGDGTTTT